MHCNAFAGNLDLNGPNPRGGRKANLSDAVLPYVQEIALSEQVSYDTVTSLTCANHKRRACFKDALLHHLHLSFPYIASLRLRSVWHCKCHIDIASAVLPSALCMAVIVSVAQCMTLFMMVRVTCVLCQQLHT